MISSERQINLIPPCDWLVAIAIATVWSFGASAADAPRKFDRGYEQVPHCVTISGRATNETGVPVAGAKVYLYPRNSNYMAPALLADTTTDAAGRYVFKDLNLPVFEYPPQAVPKPMEGGFQVFATADDYGFVWRKPYAYRPAARPADDRHEFIFYRDEPLQVDIQFEAAARLRGTITNDAGQPLAGAVVQVAAVNQLRDPEGKPPSTWVCTYKEGSKHERDGSFDGLRFLPESFRITRTDARGNYELRQLPRDAQMLFFVDYRRDHIPLDGSITTSVGNDDRWNRFVGFDGVLDHAFESPRTLQVQVKNAETMQPVAGAAVRVIAKTLLRAGHADRTNSQGTASLRLPVGKYTLVIDPPLDLPVGPLQREIEIEREPTELATEMLLAPLVPVTFEVIAEPQSTPIAGIRMQMLSRETGEWKEVQSRIGRVDHPWTLDDGRFDAMLEPGQYRFTTSRVPDGYKRETGSDEWHDLVAGRHAHLQFRLVTIPREDIADATAPDVTAPEPTTDDEKLLHQFAGKLQATQHPIRGRIQMRGRGYVPNIPRDELLQLVKSLQEQPFKNALPLMKERIPDLRLDPIEFITDGTRSRNISRYPGSEGKPESVSDSSFNGDEEMYWRSGSQQIDLFDRANSTRGTLQLHDFWKRPTLSFLTTRPRRLPPGQEFPKIEIRRDGKNLEILIAPPYSNKLVLDEATGFLRQESSQSDEKSGFRQDYWQLFPSTTPDGLVYPQLTIEAKSGYMSIYLIDQVDIMERLPVDAFTVAIPAGTTIVSYLGIPRDQQQGKGPRVSRLTHDVPDIAAHVSQWPAPRKPKLQVGAVAPPLKPVAWVNQQGEAAPAVLAGKIVLIDFWAIWCGPCQAELPQVQEAAQHFANTDLVILGWHDTSTDVETLAAFATKKGLTYPLAIDTPSPEGFGAAFAAYDIRGIPESVIVDRDGKVAFIGRFKDALEFANTLLKKN